MAHRQIGLLLGLIAATLMIGAACDSSTEPGNSSGSSSGGATDDAGGGSDVDAGADAKAIGAKCAAEKTIESCADCCGGSGSIAPYEDAFEKCACEGPCQTQCASTLCAATPNDPDDTCFDCLDAVETAAACHPAGAAACDKDPKCSQFIACDEVARCLEKDPDADGD